MKSKKTELSIVHASHRFWPCIGGIESHVKQLCENLNDKGIETKVVCLNKDHNSSQRLPKSEKVNGIKVERIEFLDLGFYKIAPGIIRCLKDNNIIHVHGIGFFSDFLAVTKPLHRKKLILSTHGGIFHTNSRSLFKRAYFYGWNRLALKAFDKIIAVSKPDLKLFKTIANDKKLVLIENPIEIDGNKKIRKPKTNSFLFVGRLSKNKGIANLLKAFAEARRENKEFFLNIAGKEFDLSKKEVEAIATKIGIQKNVKVLGKVSEKKLAKLYSESEFFVSASQYEGFGITVIEAMSSGLIPILNDIPAFKRFVAEKNGVVVDFDSSEKAGRAITKAMKMDNREKRKIENNAIEFAKGFSWKNNIGKFEQAYNSVVQN